MTNLYHLAVFNDGVPRWNAWREAHPDVRPELSGAYLAGRDLAGINFSRTDLVSADLSPTNLSRANFRTAILQHATLRAARLREADLTEARGVSSEQLGGADLAEAKLPDTLLKREGLTEIERTAKSLHQLFFVLLAGYVYAGLTIATTSHAHLLTNATSSELLLRLWCLLPRRRVRRHLLRLLALFRSENSTNVAPFSVEREPEPWPGPARRRET
jgi:uncharacterized protein YjbI with pentapeptide repeats